MTSWASRWVGRVRAVHANRGALGLLAFAGNRIFRVRDDLLFGSDLPQVGAAPDDAALEGVVIVDRSTMGDARAVAAARQVLTGENETYREDLGQRDLLYACLDGPGNVVSYAFVLFETPTKRLLRVPTAVPLIANCFTIPEARGKRLYPRLLRFVCEDLARRGHARVFINCASDNAASIRGIERAGFRKLAEIRTGLVLSRLVFMHRFRPSLESAQGGWIDQSR